MPADTLHQRLIQNLLLSEGVVAYGFADAHKSLCREIGASVATPAFLPDAYRVNREACEIELYEVEVYNPLHPNKIRSLASYWEDWDSEGQTDWLPVLVVVNRYGGQTRLDLSDALYGTGPFAEIARLTPSPNPESDLHG